MRIFTISFLLAFAAPSAMAALPTDNPQASALDNAVQAASETFFADTCHVGLAIGVYNQGKVSFYNYGTTSKVKPALPTKDSLFEIGSVTKTFTGTLAARALLDGKMTLDGDFRTYLKDAYPNLEMNGKPITLRTLAAHTAGMPRDIPNSEDLFKNPDFEKLPYQLQAREKVYDRDRYLKELRDARLVTEPGQTMSYSNIGIKLVGFGLEDAYGKSYSALLEDQVFKPLGMDDTGLTVSRKNKGRRALGYGPTGKPAPYVLPNLGAAGGLISSTSDMMKYAAWHLDEANPVVRTAHTVIHGDEKTYGETLMWQVITTEDGERKLWQSGGVFGMSSATILFPDAKRGYVLLANDACFDTQSQLQTLALSVHAALKTQ
ncbi:MULTISPECIES: serine hydrolase [Asticcacaulis]|uniref:serine hydrolase domain-containing protein n=1 Tax=Asticcacaulis TaxID=76890 RepID=UPI001AEBA162|nr:MULTISPECIES: serine hydrolase domain-containing protein [Asticcacaulis]MBP2160878.1 CubicO group peptidase (beta-lactamase class C family) [Asticcacaulis solisilvae]MDR6801918.1 CubicO group peptidase (beta-lactamase class C family) [Asticcacaulis sp. BE141]